MIILLKLLEEEQALTGKKAKKIQTVYGYFSNNRYRMKYNNYLSKGYPIASGVIEGACRHVVKDRMERSGMRGSIKGAESLLKLRCIMINDEWKTYMDFHIQQENQRIYPKFTYCGLGEISGMHPSCSTCVGIASVWFSSTEGGAVCSLKRVIFPQFLVSLLTMLTINL